MGSYVPSTREERREMLRAIGLEDYRDLYKDVPQEMYLDRPLNLPEGMSVVGAWLGLVAFALQIYFDFSGYSDMAVGLGKLFGFHFPENFNHPYVSRGFTDFWRRWHITLSTWFREYVYIPLGGNRRGRARTILNLFAVWLLTGLWHGAAFNFILWGLYWFLLLVLTGVTLACWVGSVVLARRMK